MTEPAKNPPRPTTLENSAAIAGPTSLVHDFAALVARPAPRYRSAGQLLACWASQMDGFSFAQMGEFLNVSKSGARYIMQGERPASSVVRSNCYLMWGIRPVAWDRCPADLRLPILMSEFWENSKAIDRLATEIEKTPSLNTPPLGHEAWVGILREVGLAK
jgi:hypothetical protein